MKTKAFLQFESSALRDYVYGAATVIDILPTYSLAPWQKTDASALYSDWLTVQSDICKGFETVASDFKLMEPNTSNGKETRYETSQGLQRAEAG